MSAEFDDGGSEPLLRLIDWTPIGKGTLLGKAAVRLACGLEIIGATVFEKNGGRWVLLPAEPARDFAGDLMKDDRGRTRYKSPLRWSTRTLQDAFSAAVLAAVEAEHGPLGEAPEAGRSPVDASPLPDQPRRRSAYANQKRSNAAAPSDRPSLDDEIPELGMP